MILIIAALLYALSPFDIIPDLIPGWGWIDDVVVLSLLWRYILTGRLPPFIKPDSFQARKEKKRQGFSQQEEQSAAGDADTDKTPHEIFGIPSSATKAEIRAAYRKLANMYHPDKVHHLSDEFRRLAAVKFKAINQAYQELIDPH